MNPIASRRMMIRLARVLASASGLAALLAGLPWALLALVGNPMTGLPRLTQTWITGTAIQDLIALFVWLLWGIFVAALAIEAIAVLRGTHAPRLGVLSPAQTLATLLVAGLLSTPVASAAAVSPHRFDAATAASAVTVAAPQSTTSRTGASLAAAAADVVTVRVGKWHYTYRVRHGDTLWHIADAWLGNPLRWHDIYHLNRRHYDQHGRMRHGNLILPGWILQLPADAVPPPGADPTPPPARPSGTPTATASASPAISTPVQTQPPSGRSTAGASATPTHAGRPSAVPAPSGHASPVAPSGVQLSDGAWLDLGLAAALLTGAALVWAHRRRRYIPQQPSPHLRLDDPELAPVPDTIRRLRRALSPNGDVDEPNDPTAADDFHNGPNDLPIDPPASDYIEPAVTDSLDQKPLVLPTLSNPTARLWPLAGLGLLGPGAEHAARGFLVTALASDGEEPNAHAQVVIPSATLATLLGADAVLLGDSPRLHVTAGLGDALNLLEQATLARTRMVYDSEADNITDLREQDSFADPTPPLLLIADASAPHERTRIASLLTQGQRLDIAGVLLGDWPDGNTVAVAADGATTTADHRPRHGPHPADLGQLTVLGTGQAADLLRTAIEADTGRPQPAATPTTQTELPPVPQPPDFTAERTDPATRLAEPHAQIPSEQAPDRQAPVDGAAAPADTAMPARGNDDRTASAQAASQADAAALSQPAQIRVLGSSPRILGTLPEGTSKPMLRVKAREILAYLAAHHPRGVTEDALYDQVLPDVRANQVRKLLNTYLSNLRANLRAVAGPGAYVLRPKDSPRCFLDPDRFDCDLWRMQEHLRHAQTTTNPTERAVALRAAVAEYTGPFADGHAYEWVEPVREAVRRQAIDAHVALAELLTPDDRAAAIAVLEQAITYDRYNEVLYQQAMRLHAENGNTDAIRQLRRDLTYQLTDIGLEPSDDTIALADRLVNDLSRSRRGSSA